MYCPSCGATQENSIVCTECGPETVAGYEQNDSDSHHEAIMNQAEQVTDSKPVRKSTLIEFPGVHRNSVPEWRKELSERVREVQERKAREAAADATVKLERQENDSAAPPPQLELLPAAEVPTMNPLVVAALRRIERAHQPVMAETRSARTNVATAVAYAPTREDVEPETIVPVVEQLQFDTEIQMEEPTLPVEKTHNLVVVTPEPVAEVAVPITPKRLIVDDPNDPALNYLDSISRDIRVDELDHNRASAFRRLIGAVLDLIICALLTSPIAFAVVYTGNNIQEKRTIAVLAGCCVIVTFIYLTLTTALTGRTWAMRLLSLRVIDKKTGLIPTGSQSIGRSFFYLISLATAGIGILFALVSREGYTAHDKFTRTAVIVS